LTKASESKSLLKFQGKLKQLLEVQKKLYKQILFYLCLKWFWISEMDSTAFWLYSFPNQSVLSESKCDQTAKTLYSSLWKLYASTWKTIMIRQQEPQVVIISLVWQRQET